MTSWIEITTEQFSDLPEREYTVLYQYNTPIDWVHIGICKPSDSIHMSKGGSYKYKTPQVNITHYCEFDRPLSLIGKKLGKDVWCK